MWKRETGLKVIEWAKKLSAWRWGNFINICRQGRNATSDVNLIKNISNIVEIPVIASGGMGTTKDMIDAVLKEDAVSMASVLHYNKLTLGDQKSNESQN